MDIFVVWTGADNGEFGFEQRVPYAIEIDGSTQSGIAEVPFRRDFRVGRLTAVLDSERDAAVVQYYTNHADPDYFSVYQGAPEPDPEYLRRMYSSNMMTREQFAANIGKVRDVEELKSQFVTLNEVGVSYEFTSLLEARINMLEEEKARIEATMQKYSGRQAEAPPEQPQRAPRQKKATAEAASAEA